MRHQSIQARKRLMLAMVLFLGACSSTSKLPTSVVVVKPASQEYGTPPRYLCNYASINQKDGQFYKDDGGPLELPLGLDEIPEPIPQNEPLHRHANKIYSVMGQTFQPIQSLGSYTGRGIASWYGRKFHGRKTSSGETYDMFQMTAAHPTLPIPSYARVDNLKNGRSVVVRINDRGPFLRGREIDLSFLAACRLGYVMDGHTEVEVISLAAPNNEPLIPTSPKIDPLAELIEQISTY